MQRFIIGLSAPPNFKIIGFPGFASYSIVMDVLESMDPDLIAIRRSGKIPTDFAVRPLTLKGDTLTLDVTTLSRGLTDALTKAILEGTFRTRLGVFDIRNVRVEAIDPKYLISSSSAVRKFSIRFRTPTFLRAEGGVRGGVFIPMPIPSRIISSLHKSWNTFFGDMESEDEREEFRKWLDSWAIVVSGLKIRTEKIEDEGKFYVGFVGVAKFAANMSYYNEEFLRKVDALLRFGEFANLGGLRSKGFGVISYIRDSEGSSRMIGTSRSY
jgi:CRISPR-associated endoribonuclease Cas6